MDAIMENKKIEDLRGGERLEKPFLLQRCDLRQTRNGKFYLDMLLSDSSGSIPAKRWDANEQLFEALRSADIVLIKGTVETYKDDLQISVDQVRTLKPHEVNVGELLPRTTKDIDQMWRTLIDTGATVRNKHLRALIDKVVSDPEISAAFKISPAGISYHHACVGGLLEHTVSLLALAEKVLPSYEHLDRDILLTGIILHDIGKIRELSRDTGFKYTDEGELIGHIILGVMIIEDKAREIEDFPRELLMQLQHLVLSHHGEHEFGSPKLPMTMESIALHHLDNLDAKLAAFTNAVENEGEADSKWTQYNKMFQRRLYRG